MARRHAGGATRSRPGGPCRAVWLRVGRLVHRVPRARLAATERAPHPGNVPRTYLSSAARRASPSTSSTRRRSRALQPSLGFFDHGAPGARLGRLAGDCRCARRSRKRRAHHGQRRQCRSGRVYRCVGRKRHVGDLEPRPPERPLDARGRGRVPMPPPLDEDTDSARVSTCGDGDNITRARVTRVQAGTPVGQSKWETWDTAGQMAPPAARAHPLFCRGCAFRAVRRGGIEPPTRGFSVPCSTD